MSYNGHDPKTGHLFSWDREFKHVGRVPSPPDDCFLPADETLAAAAGAYFLNGVRRAAKVFWSDGDKEAVVFAWVYHDEMVLIPSGKPDVLLHDRVVLCGPVVADPAKVAAFCRRFPANQVGVCPLVDELAAFGCLAKALCDRHLDRLRRADLFQPCEGKLPFESRVFEPNMEGDGFGRMAFVVSQGITVLNDMKHGPGVSPFYGRLLSRAPVSDSPVFIVNADCVEKFLSPSPTAIREAARCVPVLCAVSDEFRKTAGWDKPEAVAFVSGLDQGLSDFLRFYGVMTKRGVLASHPIKLGEMDGTLPVFRYNEVYAPVVSEYREIHNGPEGVL